VRVILKMMKKTRTNQIIIGTLLSLCLASVYPGAVLCVNAASVIDDPSLLRGADEDTESPDNVEDSEEQEIGQGVSENTVLSRDIKRKSIITADMLKRPFNPLLDGGRIDYAWQGDKIVFGTYNGSRVVWDVLDPDKDRNSKRDILMVTDTILGKDSFSKMGDGDYLKASELKSTLSQLSSSMFDGLQLSCVLPQSYSGSSEYGLKYSKGFLEDASISNEKLFLLSAYDMDNSDYGFFTTGAGGIKSLTRVSGRNGSWWLRSDNSANHTMAGVVTPTGYITTRKAVAEAGVAPAAVINGDNIAFLIKSDTQAPTMSYMNDGSSEPLLDNTSYISDEDDGSSFGLSMIEDEGSGYMTFEPVLYDLSLKEPEYGIAGNTDLDKGDVEVKVTDCGDKGYVSAMLMDSEGQIAAYGRMAKADDEVSFKIEKPENLKDGSYALYVFTENQSASGSRVISKLHNGFTNSACRITAGGVGFIKNPEDVTATGSAEFVAEVSMRCDYIWQLSQDGVNWVNSDIFALASGISCTVTRDGVLSQATKLRIGMLTPIMDGWKIRCLAGSSNGTYAISEVATLHIGR